MSKLEIDRKSKGKGENKKNDMLKTTTVNPLAHVNYNNLKFNVK